MNEDLGNDQEMDDEVDIAMNNEGDWMRICRDSSAEGTGRKGVSNFTKTYVPN